LWSTLERPADVISPQGELISDVRGPAWQAPRVEGSRINAAILFGDIRGFSALREVHLVSYVENVLGSIARVLDEHEGHVLTSNTWGDAFFAVVDNAGEAASCALAIQRALSDLDPAAHGLPARMAMRIGAHFGPVRPVWDPVQQRQAYMGFQVVRAARIEPVAEPGMVWVTEAFAAALALEPGAGFSCDYLGQVDLAKSFGRQPLYRLHERHAA